MVAVPRSRGWALPAVAACGIACVIGVLLLLLIVPVRQWDAVTALIVAAVAFVPLAAGTLVAMRLPRHPAGPLLAAAGTCLITTNAPGSVDLGPFAGTWMLLYLPFAILLLVLPDGRAMSARWRAAGWVITGVAASFIALCAVGWAISPWSDALTVPTLVLPLVFFGLLVLCAAAPVARYRRADERDRLRLRWVFLAGASVPFTLLLCWASYLVLGGPELVGAGLIVMFLAIPCGTAVALLRPGLFDVDRAAVATVTATVLSAAALGILSIASATAGIVLVAWSPTVAVLTTAALTAAAVIAYRPVRVAFDRLLYPERGRALAALRQLSAQVERGEAQSDDVEAVLRVALRDDGLCIGYRSIVDGTLLARDGCPVAASTSAVMLRARGEDIGAIVPSPSCVKRPPVDVARAAVPLVDAARVGMELSRARREVEASRERLLRAGYEERRRLERDLHDGAQQRLVALGMRLRVLQRTSGNDELTGPLDAVVAELSTAVAELRRIAHGMRPSALDDGLVPALADLGRLAPGTIEFDVRAPDLSDAVATTAYYVVSESVANALRHAAPTRIRVSVHGDAERLKVQVSDDGRGGACVGATGGLTGLSDRVAALGGAFTVSSVARAGTTVEAVLPCGS